MVEKVKKSFIDNVDPEVVGVAYNGIKKRLEDIRIRQALGARIKTFDITVDEMESIIALLDSLNMCMHTYGMQLMATEKMIDSLIKMSPLGPLASKIEEIISSKNTSPESKT